MRPFVTVGDLEAVLIGTKAPMGWVGVQDLVWSRDVPLQAEINRNKYGAGSLDEFMSAPMTDDQVLTDYWIMLLANDFSFASRDDALVAAEDLLDLAEMFHSSYPLSMLDVAFSKIIRDWSLQEQLAGRVAAARESAPPGVKSAWRDFEAECCGA